MCWNLDGVAIGSCVSVGFSGAKNKDVVGFPF
jgi:hypothetical protein